MTNGNEPMHPAMDFNQHTDGSGNMELRYEGLTKREYFAAMAMQGICTSCEQMQADSQKDLMKAWQKKYGDNVTLAGCIAIDAVEIADALIAALNTTQQQDNG